MSTNDESRSLPKSMRHKQVLDVAEDNPEASIEEIASTVPSATVELVERVLEKHGDPASEDTPAESESGETEQDRVDGTTDEQIAAGATEASDERQATEDTDGSDSTDTTSDMADANTDESDSTDTTSDMADANTDESDSTDTTSNIADANTDESEPDAESYPVPAQLSAKQREVLAVVAEHPGATQQAIGEQLGVSGATVSNRVNSIEGFDWSERAQFVDAVFDEQPTHSAPSDGETADSTSADAHPTDTGESASRSKSVSDSGRPDRDERLDTIETTLERLDGRVATLEANHDDNPALSDPELLHKVVHACMRSDVISEDEELRIIRELLD